MSLTNLHRMRLIKIYYFLQHGNILNYQEETVVYKFHLSIPLIHPFNIKYMNPYRFMANLLKKDFQ